MSFLWLSHRSTLELKLCTCSLFYRYKGVSMDTEKNSSQDIDISFAGFIDLYDGLLPTFEGVRGDKVTDVPW